MNNIEPNFAILTLTDTRVISFFSGIGEKVVARPNHIVALILRRDEKPMKFKEILRNGTAKILSLLEGAKYEEILPELFKEMTKIN